MKTGERESERWLLQAEDDFRFVQWLLKEEIFFDKGCFIAQQSGEKALKACLYYAGRRRVIGHSLYEMINDLSRIHRDFSTLISAAKHLDRFYITTRYPNGLPGGSPFQVFEKEDLVEAASDLGQIITRCQKFIHGEK